MKRIKLNCLIRGFIEEKKKLLVKMKGTRGRRRKQLLNDLQETRGYCKLKDEALILIFSVGFR
jgi:hypothetical protein